MATPKLQRKGFPEVQKVMPSLVSLGQLKSVCITQSWTYVQFCLVFFTKIIFLMD